MAEVLALESVSDEAVAALSSPSRCEHPHIAKVNAKQAAPGKTGGSFMGLLYPSRNLGRFRAF
jgi:hypothetical protein